MIDDYEQNLSRLAAWLADPENAQPAFVVADDARLAATPGLYAWHGDEIASELVGKLFDPAPVGPLYVGRINATLQLRTGRNRLRNTKASSLRCSLAAMLWDELELRCIGAQTIDPVGSLRLTDWMLEHLSVAIAPVATRSVIAPLEEEVLRRLDPPLNLTKVGWSPGRTRAPAAPGPAPQHGQRDPRRLRARPPDPRRGAERSGCGRADLAGSRQGEPQVAAVAPGCRSTGGQRCLGVGARGGATWSGTG